MSEKLDNLENKIDSTIAKFLPEGKQAKTTNAWLATCAATVATGLYTYMIDWNPGVRAGAHLFGAMAMPAGGAFVSNTVMNGIESVANYRINQFNKKNPETQKEQFKINPKVRNAVNLLSSAAVGIAYTYGTLGTEVAQFSASGIMQWGQYAADVGGSLIGIAAFHNLDLVETTASFAKKIRDVSYAIVKPINAIEDKLKGKNKEKSEPTHETTSPLTVEDINISPDVKNIKKETPAWDLSLYQDSNENIIKETKPEPKQTPHQKEENNELLDEEDEIDI